MAKPKRKAVTKPVEREPDTLAPGHHCGERTGYEVFGDGSIQVCPSYRETYLTTMAEDAAIRELVETVWQLAARLLASVRQRQEKWWQAIGEDCRIDTSEYLYTPATGKLRKRPPAEPATKEANA